MRRSSISLILVGLLAVLGFWVASWLFATPEPVPVAAPVVKKTRFPRPNAKATARAVARRTHVVRGGEDEREPVKRDPLMVAFRPDAQTALVMETRELLDTPAGQLITNCLARDQTEALDRMVEATGLNPFEDVDRWGMFGDDAADNSDVVVIAEGDFTEMKFDDAVESGQLMAADSYGDYAEIFALPEPSGTEPAAGEFHAEMTGGAKPPDPSLEMVYGRWSDTMVLMGTRAEVEASIDRLEGRAEPGGSAIPEHEAYGEVYGLLGGNKLAAMMPPQFREGLASADSAKFHLDAPDDVFFRTDVVGSGSELRETGEAMAETLVQLRIAAEALGNEDLLDLLDLASVAPSDEGLSVETAIPLDMLQKHMAEHCKPRPKKPRRVEGLHSLRRLERRQLEPSADR